MQASVLVISLSLIGLVAVLFAWVVLNSTIQAEPAPDKAALERRRVFLIWGFVVLGFVVTYASLKTWPHDARASEDTVEVDVIASQWSWEISRNEVPLATPVVFNVGSRDVNHGIGVYDPDGTLLFQTQAMPGVTNRVRHTFAKAGTYRILCMEYCGLAHHGMTDEINVVQQ